MASLLMDSILNETIQNFRDHQLLQSSLGLPNSTDTNVSFAAPKQPASGSNLSQQMFDQIDSMTSLEMVETIGGKERFFWVVLFSSMVLVAAGGNVIVIYVVSTNKEMKSVTNYFLVNLSLADTMVSTLNVIFNFISMLDSHWPFGRIYCKISNFIAILSIAASVFTLTAISCDRYTAIIHPLRPRMSHRNALSWILLIWTLSIVLALPNLIYSDIISDGNVSFICSTVWPDGRYPVSSYDHVYNIMILVCTFLVPISTMAILYYKVGKELWGHEAIGEPIDKQQRALKSKKKIVKMMIVVVIMFALCWLPYHAFFVANYYWPTFQDVPLLYQRAYLIMYWLAMSNSMYNPIIIYFMNSKFRLEFKRVLYFIFCCKTYQAPISNPNPKPNIDQTARVQAQLEGNQTRGNQVSGELHESGRRLHERLSANLSPSGESTSLAVTKITAEAGTPLLALKQHQHQQQRLTDEARPTRIEVIVTTHPNRQHNHDHQLTDRHKPRLNGAQRFGPSGTSKLESESNVDQPEVGHEPLVANRLVSQPAANQNRLTNHQESEPFLAGLQEADNQVSDLKRTATQTSGNESNDKRAKGSCASDSIRNKVWI